LIPDNKDLEKTDAIIEELKDWPAAVLNSHKSASHPIHKLVFLADTGFNVEDARIRTITDKILQNKSKEGLYQVKMNIRFILAEQEKTSSHGLYVMLP
jgi:hypothetical protein